MINNLHVKNLALIDEVEINFTKGLNILTGETGAGKSIIIGSLGLALGDRADSDSIRQGAEFGLVELSISLEDIGGINKKQILEYLSENDISTEDECLLIKRRIYPGRSDCKINGETVTLKQLSYITSMLIDICGQRESLSLLKETSLKTMLDKCGGDKLLSLLDTYQATYKEYTDIISKLDNSNEDESLRKRKMDLAEYEIQEIEEADLREGEDVELEASYRKYVHMSRIVETLSRIESMFNGDNGALGLISKSLREIRQVSEYDDTLPGIESMLYDIEGMSSDLHHELNSYLSSCDYDAEEFSIIESRLNLINRLKDKYGSTIPAIIKYKEERSVELWHLQDYDAYMSSLLEERDRKYSQLMNYAEQIHSLRSLAADKLSALLIEALKDMNFINCDLRVSVEADKEHLSKTGYDKIDFLISMNPGESLRPLSSIASGGELSRIMLAIKCVTGDRDNISTMVFDEIDTGISGITAWKVGEKLDSLSDTHQLICITHQAQIAAQADTHFLISKSVQSDRTLTSIAPLSRDQMIKELARMMGSDELSTAAISAAEELKARAGK